MKKTRTVRPEDFKDQAWLLAGPEWFISAVENGELEWKPKVRSDDELRQQVYEELMKFVKPIRQYAAPEWLKGNRIDSLWEKIMANRHLYVTFIGKKGPGRNHLSLYRATAFVIALCDKNVYLEAKGTLKKALLPSSFADNVWKNATTNAYKVDKEEGEERELERIISEVKIMN